MIASALRARANTSSNSCCCSSVMPFFASVAAMVAFLVGAWKSRALARAAGDEMGMRQEGGRAAHGAAAAGTGGADVGAGFACDHGTALLLDLPVPAAAA